MQPSRDPIELSRQMVYFNAERTLSGWMRTALSLMALGFVIDRFDLVLSHLQAVPRYSTEVSQRISDWSGSVMIGLGVIMVVTAGIRYLLFALAYRRDGSTGTGQGLIYGAVFAFLLGIFGLILVGVLATVLR